MGRLSIPDGGNAHFSHNVGGFRFANRSTSFLPADVSAIMAGAGHVLDPSGLLAPEMGWDAGSFGSSSILTTGTRQITMAKSGTPTSSVVGTGLGSSYFQFTLNGASDEFGYTYGANPPTVNNATMFAAIYYTAGASCRLVELHPSQVIMYAPLNSGTGSIRTTIGSDTDNTASDFLTADVINVISVSNVISGGEKRLEATRYTTAGGAVRTVLDANGITFGDATAFNMFQGWDGGRLYHAAAFANVPSWGVGSALTRAQEATYGAWLAEQCGV